MSKFRQQRESLRSKLETLKVLDEDILSNVEDENIEEEIQEADLVSELIQLSITRIDDFLETSRPPAKSVSAPKQEENLPASLSALPPASSQETIPRVKLPKLDLRKFDGNVNVSTWPTFWDAFESSVH